MLFIDYLGSFVAGTYCCIRVFFRSHDRAYHLEEIIAWHEDIETENEMIALIEIAPLSLAWLRTDNARLGKRFSNVTKFSN